MVLAAMEAVAQVQLLSVMLVRQILVAVAVAVLALVLLLAALAVLA
jgi:hypothetical protein